MTKIKKIVLCASLSVASISLAVAAIHVSKNISNGFLKTNGAVHDASCVWNHYDAVMPTTSEHGSQEFWACCTHPGNFVLEEPTVTNPSQITDCGEFAGASFAALEDSDDRYIPQLEAATALDEIAPVTLSDIGVTSGTTLPSSPHTYGHYDYPEQKGIDLWFEFSFTPIATDSWMYFYLFNQGDEAGIVCRIQTNRTENDGIIPCYIYSQLDYSANPGTTVVHTAGAAGTFFYFPRVTGVKSTTTNIMHATAYCLDEATNLYRCAFTMGVKDGIQHYPSTNPEDLDNVVQTFDICLGANYFDSSLNRRVRFSVVNVSDFKISDASSEEKSVIYKDAAGNLLGKINNPGTAKLPNLKVANKTFLGWYDNQGNKAVNGSAVAAKTVLSSRFVANQTNMFVPSDTLGNEFAAAKTGWFESSSFEGECGGQLPVSSVSDRYDFYYIYHFVSRSNDDNYAIFGLPFDFSDAKTRLHLRIDNPTNSNLVGYIYGGATNLGNAGAAGTNFSQAGFRANGSDLLIHMTISNASADGLTLGVEIMNLGDGQVYQTSRDVTFNNAGLYGIDNPARNIFDCMKANCEYRIRDAF